MGDFQDEWAAWRVMREARLRNPQGYFAITAMHWLSGTPDRFEDVPGTWSGGDGTATVALETGEELGLGDDRLAAGTHTIGPLDDVGLTVTFGDAIAEVADRGGQSIVRPRHPDSPILRAYRGTPCYPPDPGWVVRGRFAPYAVPEDEAVGEIVFAHGGGEHRLVAWGEDDGSLWVLFRDATSGVTTYPANRQLLAAPPSPDGTVEIDFNRAINMPCAYTDFVTCPLPPRANTLPFAVEAGEQTPTTVMSSPSPGS